MIEITITAQTGEGKSWTALACATILRELGASVIINDEPLTSRATVERAQIIYQRKPILAGRGITLTTINAKR